MESLLALPCAIQQIIVNFAYSRFTFHRHDNVIITDIHEEHLKYLNGLGGEVIGEFNERTRTYLVKVYVPGNNSDTKNGELSVTVHLYPWHLIPNNEIASNIKEQFYTVDVCGLPNVLSQQLEDLVMFQCVVKTSDCVIHLRLQIAEYSQLPIRDILFSQPSNVPSYDLSLLACDILDKMGKHIILINTTNARVHLPSLSIKALFRDFLEHSSQVTGDVSRSEASEHSCEQCQGFKAKAVEIVESICELNSEEKKILVEKMDENGCIQESYLPKHIKWSGMEYIMYLLQKNGFQVFRQKIPVSTIW